MPPGSGDGAETDNARRRVLKAIGASGLSGFAGCGVGADSAPSCASGVGDLKVESRGALAGWPMPSYNARRTHASPNDGPRKLSLEWRVRRADFQQWTGQTDAGLHDVAIPLVTAPDHAFLQGDTALHAVDPREGTHQWSLDVDFETTSWMYLLDNILVSTVDAAGTPNAALVGIDVDQRSEAWRRPLPESRYPVGLSDTVYLYGENGGSILNPESGQAEVTGIRGPGGAVPELPAEFDGPLYGVGRETVYAVNPTTQSVEWEHSIDLGADVGDVELVDYHPVDEAAIYVSKSYSPPDPRGSDPSEQVTSRNDEIIAIDRMTGDRLWEYSVNGGLMTVPPTLVAGVVIVGGRLDRRLGDRETSVGFLEAIDANEGCRYWRHTTFDRKLEEPHPRMAVASSSLYVATHHRTTYDHGALYAIDVRTGDRVAKRSFEGVTSRSPPIVSHGRVFIQVRKRDRSELRVFA